MTSIRSFINQLFFRQNFITIVSGLPRSGTSMMMSALEAGGMPLLVDDIRQADVNNPRGYFEFERVKKLARGDNAWLTGAQGKAVKVISALLEFLPSDFQYRVIFMERELDEVLSSQQCMLVRTGKVSAIVESDEQALRQSYQQHLVEVATLVTERDWMRTLFVSYNETLQNPQQVFNGIAQFLGQAVNPGSMAKVVDPTLYREKGT